MVGGVEIEQLYKIEEMNYYKGRNFVKKAGEGNSERGGRRKGGEAAVMALELKQKMVIFYVLNLDLEFRASNQRIINIFTLEIQKMETPFIKKIKKIMQDPDNADAITWSQDNTMIQIKNQKIFQEKVLSRHFRHNRISSFVRQLNLYGFKKIRSTDSRIFTHPFLLKGLGLDAIINKKKKCQKGLEDQALNDSVKVQPNFDIKPQEKVSNTKKETVSQYRISQNLIQFKEIPQSQKAIIATNNTIAPPEQPLNAYWFMPLAPIQQQVWKIPYLNRQEGSQVNFAYSFYPNWC